MTTLELQRPITTEAPRQAVISPIRAAILEESMQERGVLVDNNRNVPANQVPGVERRNGNTAPTVLFEYRQQRLKAMASDWDIISGEFSGQFQVPDYGKPGGAIPTPAR
jgi:hypothetical protein